MNLSSTPLTAMVALALVWPVMATAETSSASSALWPGRIRTPSSLIHGAIVSISTDVPPRLLQHGHSNGINRKHWHCHRHSYDNAGDNNNNNNNNNSRSMLAALLRHYRGGHADYIGEEDDNDDNNNDDDNDDVVPQWENERQEAEITADDISQHTQQYQQQQFPPRAPWTNYNYQQNPQQQQQQMQHQSSTSIWGGGNNHIGDNSVEDAPSLPGGVTAAGECSIPPPRYPTSQEQHQQQQWQPQAQGMGGHEDYRISQIPPSSGSSLHQQQQHQQPQQRHGQYPYSQQYQQYPPQQQQQQLQQRHPPNQISQFPPPPNLPGSGYVGSQGIDRRPYQQQQQQSQHANTIHNAHYHRHAVGIVPGGKPNTDMEEDDDYLIDHTNNDVDDINDDSDKEGGEVGGVGGGGGDEDNIALSPTDLSQFDKDVIFSGLKRLYRKKIRPLELSSKYGHFHSPPLSPSDFDSKPMVLLLGQYSVGKTSFIRYLLGRDFPGQRIGPEPTTDRFVAIVKGEVGGDKIIPGAALCSQADKPFRGLSSFGNNFLNRFEGVEMDSPILNNITLVDTPGILSGQKQSIGRNYDYEQVMRWFAERSDLIIIMFDAHKLDISDELKRVIELLKPHQDKVRVLLNKADSVSTQQLMRVYGSLMWSLGKVMLTPEVCRVYMGSFWGAPLKNREQAALLMRERQDLFDDIARLPQNAVMRRINELVKRARSVKVHAYIMHYLRKQLPYTWGKREKQRRLIDRLDREFVMCARRYELPRGDFPELEPFRQALLEIKDLSEIHKLDKKMVKEMDKVFSVDIPNLLLQAKFHG